MSGALLEVRQLGKVFRSHRREVTALHDINLVIHRATPQIVAIAGESGSGKSTLADIILGFTHPTHGSVWYDGNDITQHTTQQRKAYRQQVQAVFQDPFGVFNPFYRVGHVFDLIFKNFPDLVPLAKRRERLDSLMLAVGLNTDEILDKFPHQLSGGQRQRIMMARACLMKPRLIVADEPVSMVDASLRASILEVMMRLQQEEGITFLYITHDLATAYQISDRLLLLYQGHVMEDGPTKDIIDQPLHPYAKLLVESIPTTRRSALWLSAPASGTDEPQLRPSTSGCTYSDRCALRADLCLQDRPALAEYSAGVRRVACHFHSKL